MSIRTKIYSRLRIVSVLWIAFVMMCSYWLPIASAQTVVAWGDNTFGQTSVPSSATNVIQVAAGRNHTLALRSNGSVVVWGAITNVPDDATNITSIAAGAAHCVALRVDGSVVAWGDNSFNQTNIPPTATNVTALAVGNYHNLALRADGSVIAWGKNTNGQTNVPPLLSTNAIMITAGAEHSMAMTIGGLIVIWGGDATSTLRFATNSFPKKTVTNAVALSAGSYHNLGLRADGTVFLWGATTLIATTPSAVANIVAVSAATNFNLALRADGKLYGWGTGTVTNVPSTVSNVVSFAAGAAHAVALNGNGTPRLLSGPAYRRIVVVKDTLPLFAGVGGASSWTGIWFTNSTQVAVVANSPRPSQIISPAGTNQVACQVVVTNVFGSVTSAVVLVTLRGINLWGDNLVGQRDLPDAVVSPLSVAGGAFHNLALQTDGSVWAWGKNTDGQTNVPPSATNIVALAGGSHHSLALRDDGTVLAWGRNWSAQTNVPSNATNVVAVAAGYAHSLALRADGMVVGWGDNEFDQATTSYLAQDVVAISAGYYHNLALRADGVVVSWGLYNTVPAPVTNVTAIAAGWAHNLALRANGTVFAWGDNSFGQTNVPSNATNVIAIAAGWYHSMAMRADGTIVVWGKPAYGITNPPAGLVKASQLSTGEGHGVVLVNWGAPYFSARSQQISGSVGGQATLTVAVQTSSPSTFQWYHDGLLIIGATNRNLVLTGLQTNAVGSYVLAVTNSTGSALSQPITLSVQPAITTTSVGAWGDNLIGQSSVPPGVADPRAVAAGAFHSLAMQQDGRVMAWGKNVDGQTNVPPNLTNAIAIAAGANHSMALRADGSVVAWGRNSNSQTNTPPAATNIAAIAAGDIHCVALTSNGTLLAWGGNCYGQTQPPNVTNQFTAIAAGYFHTLALQTDNQVVSWGSQNIVPAAASNVVAIAAGWEHSLALRADGNVVAWGDDSYGQCRVPTAATNIIAISAGYGFSVAERADGAVFAWGTKNFGVTNVPSALKNVSSFSAGENHVVVLTEQGPPRFETAPRSANAHVNGSALFHVVARGSQPLKAQWLQDNAPIQNATNRPLFLTALQQTNAGEYVLTISNAVGVFASAAASLTVSAAPAIATEPRRLNHPPGLPLRISAVAQGEPALSYQWQFNGSDIPEAGRFSGTQSNELMIATTTYADNGSFSLVVSNAQGMTTGLVAQVLITPVIAWGDNTAGQLNLPAGLSNIVAVSAGDEHNLALKSDGSVVAWGNNSAGQTNVPVTAQNVVAIAAGNNHSVALLADGRMIAWGDNTNGQCNVTAAGTNIVAIAAGETLTMGLRSDGVALLWGRYNGFPNFNIGIATNSIAVIANEANGYALRADATIQPSPGFSPNANFVAIAGGGGHVLALSSNGNLTARGRNYYGQSNVPSSATNLIAFAAGGDHSLVLRSDRRLIAWGADFSGQLTAPDIATNAITISAGGAHNLAVSKQDGLPPGPQLTRKTMLGKTVLLSANSQATHATTYQWRLNGQNVAGATNAALFITNLHWTNVGNYQVIISNALGVTVGSSIALAAVRTPLAFETNGAYAPNYTNGFRARLSGSSGTGPVVFYASSNLLNWVSVYTNPPVVGLIDFVNPLADAWQKSFYRAAEVFVPTPIQFANLSVNQTNQTVRLELSGLTAAGSVVLYASTNLTQWNPIHTNPPTISPWEFFDTLSAGQPRRYYRASESR